LLSVVILGLYAYPLLTNGPTGGLFGVGIISAIAAGISLILSAVLYIIAPKEDSWVPSLILFLVFAVTVGILVFTTGGTHSAFIALWMLVAFFAGIFGVAGVLPLFIAVAVLVAYDYIAGRFSVEVIVTTVFSGILPIVAGLIVWHGRNEKQSDQTKDFKKLSSQLSEVASKSEVVINAIGDGVIAIDNQGIIQLINPAAQEMLGWGKQDALQLNYKSILQLTDKNNNPLDPTIDPIQQALNTNQQIRSSDLTIVTKSGKKIFGAVVVSPIGDAGSGIIAVFRDVTKEVTEEREQAEFISTASHEMRTPVASIEGYLGLALNPQTSQIDDKAREFINKAHESAQHLGRLFQDLLDVSKSEDGRLTNMQKVVDITLYVHDVVQGLVPKAQEKGLRLIYKPMPEDSNEKLVAPVYFVNLDNDHIREIVNNLVENGIKYTPKGDVVVDVNGTDDKVVISIKDTGIGIPTEDIPHLFQKFYRVDNVDTRQIGGTGLGLYLCRRLAEAMGGRIWVESEYKKGSTFFVELPRIDTNTATQLREQQEQAAKQAAAQPATTPFVPPTDTPMPSTPAATPPTPTEGPSTQPATTVPRGEALSREQIAAHVARLQAMAKDQQTAAANRPSTSIPVTSPTSETPPVAPVEEVSG
jgi:PAS domain S-box-containing protein